MKTGGRKGEKEIGGVGSQFQIACGAIFCKYCHHIPLLLHWSKQILFPVLRNIGSCFFCRRATFGSRMLFMLCQCSKKTRINIACLCSSPFLTHFALITDYTAMASERGFRIEVLLLQNACTFLEAVCMQDRVLNSKVISPCRILDASYCDLGFQRRRRRLYVHF